MAPISAFKCARSRRSRRREIRIELTFEMLARLGEHILTTNPRLTRALRATYPYVFLDEFQDTTEAQYALVRAGFLGSACALTAVGDPLQRVMVFAGAKADVFRTFKTDFEATPVRLLRNYRCAPRLVAIQHEVARLMSQKVPASTSYADRRLGEGECLLLDYPSYEEEAHDLADRIVRWMAVDDLDARDVCVLARMRPDHYSVRLREALLARGRKSRVEADLQDLLAEPLAIAVLDVLRLAVDERSPMAWIRTTDLLARLTESRNEARRLASQLHEDLAGVRGALSVVDTTGESLGAVLSALSVLNRKRLFAAYGQYQDEIYVETLCGQLSAALAAAKGATWLERLDDVQGKDTIPILTAVKSKGLEYDTVIFVGLEDSAHIRFAADSGDHTCGFFVALSRAKRRAVFTFSGLRPPLREPNTLRPQRRTDIQVFYNALAAQGVRPQQGSSGVSR